MLRTDIIKRRAITPLRVLRGGANYAIEHEVWTDVQVTAGCELAGTEALRLYS